MLVLRSEKEDFGSQIAKTFQTQLSYKKFLIKQALLKVSASSIVETKKSENDKNDFTIWDIQEALIYNQKTKKVKHDPEKE